MFLWILSYVIISVFCQWIIHWGGAKKISGLKSVLFFDWFTLDWNSEQIRLYCILIWIIQSVIFVVGCVKPELRFF